ncbi:MAG: CCA tRNA nucleotidyltransferase, partial [Acholeplasmatales bacterium]|nr:CCA tRNA nucleotidyltransferase [Acholeplasmatales bacterium]
MNELDSAKIVLKKIKENGFLAYFVGGFVRDYIMGIDNNDIDITTNATKDDLQKIFDKVIPTGEKFEGVTIIYNDYKFEVTTFRTDLFYGDHRHPDVRIAKTLEEDLARRDFTINALACDEAFNIIDKYDGRKDIENKIIRAVGDSSKRFVEDALRIMRAFYFSAKLNFDIDSITLKGIDEASIYLENVSGERIYRELLKMFNTKYLLKGLKYMSSSKAILHLPSLKESTNILLKYHHKVDFIEYLALSFYLEG